MSPDQTTFSGDSFVLGYRFQSYWDFHMATAFFFGELGAGLFLVSLYFGFVPGMVLGLLCTGVGKPYYHMSHMGVPMKSWRAIMRPGPFLDQPRPDRHRRVRALRGAGGAGRPVWLERRQYAR